MPAPGSETYSVTGLRGQPFAVLYEGEFETPWDGTACAVRGHAKALAASGLPVLLKSRASKVGRDPVHVVGLPDEVRAQVGDLINTSAESYFPLIRHVVIASGQHLQRILVPRGLSVGGDLEKELEMRHALQRATIVYSVWERHRIDTDIVRQLNRVAENWVPCEHNRQVLIQSGVDPQKIQVIPHPYDPADQILLLTGRKPVAGKFFYSIGRWEPRKGYHELIGAFLTEFRPDEAASLTIKYSGSGQWPDYPTPEESLAAWLADDEVIARGWTEDQLNGRLTLMSDRLPRSRIVRLHYAHNIYVSAGHGEAWCLPAFEAKLAGNGLVHVPWGGTADFASTTDVAVPYELGPVHSSYRWEADARWANYEFSALRQALRSAPAPTEYARDPKLEAYSSPAIGELMHARVMHHCAGRPAVRDYYEASRSAWELA